MADVYADLLCLKEVYEDLKQQRHSLEELQWNLGETADSVCGSASMEQLGHQLRIEAEELAGYARLYRQLEEILDRSMRLYQETEQRVLDEYEEAFVYINRADLRAALNRLYTADPDIAGLFEE